MFLSGFTILYYTLSCCTHACSFTGSQAAKTYLEKHFESFPGASLDELIRHGLKSLAASLADGELTSANTAVAVVGRGTVFTLLEDDTVAPYITALKVSVPGFT